MTTINYYLVDVFTSQKYGGNQLAVFVDFENKVSTENMLKIARELNFPEITFIKQNRDNKRFDVRIFTQEYEVPFAGHPSLGTAYVISKYILPTPQETITLCLKHADINIQLTAINNLDHCNFIMEQAQPQFIRTFEHKEIAEGLNIKLDILDHQKPIEEITTGLPYIIIPIASLEDINQITLNSREVVNFLTQNEKYKTNSNTGLTTSLFFVTEDTFETQNNYNTRMFCIENGNIIEDAATGSANGCFLSYLLKHKSSEISAISEQGFQMGRKSYIHLEGIVKDNMYNLRIGGQVVEISHGKWNV